MELWINCGQINRAQPVIWFWWLKNVKNIVQWLFEEMFLFLMILKGDVQYFLIVINHLECKSKHHSEKIEYYLFHACVVYLIERLPDAM